MRSARAAGVHDLMRAHETQLLQPLLDALADRNSVRLIGPLDAALKGADCRGCTGRIRRRRGPEAGRAWHHGRGRRFLCGSRPLQAMGVDLDKGVLRLSFVHYTHPDEVEKLIGALDKVL